MSAADILVFALCLFVGYWLVSRLMDRSSPGKPKDERPPEGTAPSTRPASPSGHGEYLPRDAHIDTRATLSNWYQILGVRENASRAEIEAAFKRRKALYPASALAMMAPERRAMAEENIRQIDAAYQLGMRLFRG